MANVEELEWQDTTETLDDVLTNPKVGLPQLIKLSSELSFIEESNVTLENGKILCILSKEKITKINGTDSSGKSVSIPMSCPYNVTLGVASENERKFDTIKELLSADPLPKFVEVTKVKGATSIKVGDVLKVLIVEKSPVNIPSIVHFRSLSNGVHIKLDIDEDVSFQVTNDKSSITLSGLLAKKKKLPITARFCDSKDTPKSYLELGTFSIDSTSTECIIIGSTDISNLEYVTVFPLSLDMKFQVNSNLKLANNKQYRELCRNYSNVNMELVHDYLRILDPKYVDSCHIIKYKKKLLKAVGSCKNGKENVDRSDKFKETATNKMSKSKQTEDKKILKKEKQVCKMESKKEKEKKKKISTATLAVKKVDDSIAKEELPQSSPPSEVTTNIDSREDQWNKNIIKKVKEACIRGKSSACKTKKHGSDKKSPESLNCRLNQSHSTPDLHSNIYLNEYEDPFPENVYCELPYATLQTANLNEYTYVVTEKSPTRNSDCEMYPPPLPGNHPLQNKISSVTKTENIYLDAVDSMQSFQSSNSIKSSLDIVKYSAQEISKWAVEDVTRCLQNLELGKYTKLFEDSLVDGKLLLDLDENILRDLGLTLFEARKLRKFILGWRPGSLRPDLYPVLKGYSSNDPSDWNTQDTVLHLHEIDIPEMAEFCEKNQIDGELLKDICVNEAIMSAILPSHDKKLKIVKIKNYVIDQWRPKKKNYNNESKIIESSQCSVENKFSSSFSKSNVLNRYTCGNSYNGSNGKKSGDSSHISQVKKLLEDNINKWESSTKKSL